MKKLLLAGCFALALVLARSALGQAAGFTNNGVIFSPIVIDATNVVNNGLFEFFLNTVSTSGSVEVINNPFPPFDFSDAVNFTNRGTMADDVGFIFDTAPSISGNRQRASNFANQNPGQILANSVLGVQSGSGIIVGTTTTIIGGTGVPVIEVNSSNMVNTGLLDVGSTGLIKLLGNNLDLTRGSITVEGFNQLTSSGGSNLISSATAVANFLDVGVYDQYWGTGTQSNKITLADLALPSPIAPVHTVTNITGLTTNAQQTFTIANTTVYAISNHFSDSNIVIQVILVGDSLGIVNPTAGFETLSGAGINTNFLVPIIQWMAVVTNNAGQLVTSALYLEDQLGVLGVFAEVTNGVALSGAQELVPTNYTITRTFSNFNSLAGGNVAYTPALFTNAFSTNPPPRITNGYTALGVELEPVTATPDPNILGSTFSNVNGRIEITADTLLDLTGVNMDAGNYLRLTSPNHFAGSAGALIVFPFADLSLGTTNGQLNITNLVAPYVPRYTGPINAWSALWTNITTTTNIVTVSNVVTTNIFTVTNAFHVLMVSSSLSPTSPIYLGDVSLRSTNVVISDLLNVSNSLFVNAQSLTITSNAPDAQTPFGEIDLLNSGILWSQSLPVLQFFTNSGLISTPNAAFFQLRQTPDFPSPGDAPYQTFVNHNEIVTEGGTIIWANYFELSGSLFSFPLIEAGFGPITVQSSTSLLENGELFAPAGDMALTSGSLTISNCTLEASGSLTLSATNLLTDSSSLNVFSAGDGFSLLVKPTLGDLLNTSVLNSALPNVQSLNTWAGIDFGVSSSGFSNNVAVGQLILNAANSTSGFHFIAAGPTNALYVDQLVLEGGATNQDPQNPGLFPAFNIDPNMTIYYADAVIGTLDISEKLNGANNGRLRWVQSFAGPFSSTNLTFPDGKTFAFNRALTVSPHISSDGDGIPNLYDPLPFPEPVNPNALQLVITATNTPTPMASISWVAPAGYTNTLLYQANGATNWSILTNFVQGSVNGSVKINDTITQTGRRYKLLLQH